jgi:hypothetical protein
MKLPTIWKYANVTPVPKLKPVTITSISISDQFLSGYPGARGYLFSPGLNIPSGEIGVVFRVHAHSTHNFQNWKERVDWLLTIGSIDYVF